MAKIDYQDNIIVSASPSMRLTPNFKAGEYAASDGSIFVHRDLVANVQIIRDSVGPLKIESTRPRGVSRGHGVTIKGDNPTAVLEAATKMVREGVLADATLLTSSAVVVSVTDSGISNNIKPLFAFDCGLQVVANYETQGDPYQQVTGNFDGAGLSFGVIQFNFKNNTLQALFQQFRNANETQLRACFHTDQYYADLWKVIDGTTSKAIVWGDSISSGRSRHKVVPEWAKCFNAVGQIEMFRRILLSKKGQKKRTSNIAQIVSVADSAS